MDWTINCFAGGKMLVVWTHNIKQDSLLFADSIHGTLKQTDCSYRHENGKLTVDNEDELIKYTKTMRYIAGRPTEPLIVDIAGTFRWSTSDGRIGACSVKYRRAFDLAQNALHHAGNICGHVVDETIDPRLTWLKIMPWEVNQAR
jgi:hypothetical protein